MKASKCVIGSDSVDFLGYHLSSEGIKPQSRLVEAIKDFHCPENKKSVRSFLGLAGFYRNFIPHFADIARPLNTLTSDNVVFSWSDSCQVAFDTLKQLLTSEPVLAYP